jgi:hypothetical protein
MSIASECVRRGFEENRIAANSLPDMPIAPGYGHNGVTNRSISHLLPFSLFRAMSQNPHTQSEK